jgi:hypothetical protein
MEGVACRKWLSLALVAVVLPTSFLTLLKAGGIIPERRVTEMMTADTVTWSMDRPTSTTGIRECIKNSWSDDISIEFCIRLDAYWENGYGTVDELDGGVNATANITTGFIYSVILGHGRTDTSSSAHVLTGGPIMKLENLVVREIIAVVSSKNEGSVTAYSANYPSQCFLQVGIDWILSDANDQDHVFGAVLTVAYFNGTAYKEVVLPIQIGVYVNTANSLQEARSIANGSYLAFGHCLDDQYDYYNITVPAEHWLDVSLAPRDSLNPDLYLYNSDGRQVALSEGAANSTELASHYAYVAGQHCIKVQATGGHGLYRLTIETTEGPPGDVDRSGLVDMLDSYCVALNYGKMAPYASQQIANCDINDDGIINMLDLYIVCMHFGET